MILAIDQSLNESGYWIKDEMNGVIKPDSKLTAIEKIIYIRGLLEDLNPPYNIHTIIMEDYSYGSTGRFTFTAGELGGMIKTFCIDHEINLIIIAPTLLKKYVCGKGNAKKEQMLLQCYKRFNKEFHNNNLCDAYCLWKFYNDYLEYKENDTKYTKNEIECFKRLEK